MFLRKTKTKKSTVQRFLTSSTAILALFFIVAPVTAQIEFRADATYNQEIWDMNQKINEISLEKEALELNIDQINLQIRNSQLKIQATEENIAEQKDRLGELIRELD